MKEYKYKINGQEYKVAVGDIENNIAEVSVNGTTYKVELEQAAAPAPVVKSVKPAEAPPRLAQKSLPNQRLPVAPAQ